MRCGGAREKASLTGGLLPLAPLALAGYYSTEDLRRDFGKIADYQAPKKSHPSSIMSVSNTGGHGRGSQAGRIVGDVINHGKHEFWGKPNVHYHQGMAAGENTLNAVCARVVLRSISEAGSYSTPAFLADYVKFMTTPGSHNDTYAESFHRDFFANYAAGVPPERCAGKEGHNTAQIGGFVMLPPVIYSALAEGARAVRDRALSHLRATHLSPKLELRAGLYANLLAEVARGRPLREAVVEAGRGAGVDVESIARCACQACPYSLFLLLCSVGARATVFFQQDSLPRCRPSFSLLPRKNLPDTAVVGSMFSTACYIEDSFPSMLYLAYKYYGGGSSSGFEEAVLANANVGGENCHRGAALGALMGAAVGEKAIPRRLIDGLAASSEIRREIDAYCAAVIAPQMDREARL